MKVLHATGNNYKFNLMKKRLSCFKEIELLNPKMLNINVDVIENGKTPEEIDNHYKSLSDRYCELVKKHILKK